MKSRKWKRRRQVKTFFRWAKKNFRLTRKQKQFIREILLQPFQYDVTPTLINYATRFSDKLRWYERYSYPERYLLPFGVALNITS